MKFKPINKLNPADFRITKNSKVCKKVYFATEADADYYIKKLAKTSKRDTKPVRAYLCEKCNCWHLTSWAEVDIDKAFQDIDAEVEYSIETLNNWIIANQLALDLFMNMYDNMVIELNNTKLELAKLKSKK